MVVESTLCGRWAIGKRSTRTAVCLWPRETLVSGDESDDPGMTLAVRGRCWCDQFQAM